MTCTSQVAFDEEIARELQNPRDEAELDGDQLDVTSDDQRWLQQLGTGDLLDRPDSFEVGIVFFFFSSESELLCDPFCTIM